MRAYTDGVMECYCDSCGNGIEQDDRLFVMYTKRGHRRDFCLECFARIAAEAMDARSTTPYEEDCAAAEDAAEARVHG